MRFRTLWGDPAWHTTSYTPPNVLYHPGLHLPRPPASGRPHHPLATPIPFKGIGVGWGLIHTVWYTVGRDAVLCSEQLVTNSSCRQVCMMRVAMATVCTTRDLRARRLCPLMTYFARIAASFSSRCSLLSAHIASTPRTVFAHSSSTAPIAFFSAAS